LLYGDSCGPDCHEVLPSALRGFQTGAEWRGSGEEVFKEHFKISQRISKGLSAENAGFTRLEKAIGGAARHACRQNVHMLESEQRTEQAFAGAAKGL
jgi:hypothetical protein